MPDTSNVTPYSPALGEDGEPCAECGAPLARDQRYCLECGRRRAGARIPFLDVLREQYAGERDAAVEEAEAAEEPPARPVPPLAVAGALGGLVLLLAVGVLVGVLAGNSGRTTASGVPQVVNLGGAVAGGNQPAALQQFTGDWPQGKNGWTVQLQTLPKSSSTTAQVAQAKTAATGKGATAVGALDSDSFSSLDPGNYLIYSGVYDTKKQAQAALGKLKNKFPGAKVVQVTGGGGGGVSSSGGNANAFSGHTKSATVDRSQLQQLQNLSPQQYQKQSSKLPDQTALPGAPPPKDNKPPGGGSGGGSVIK
jgi:hypothetical protein